LELGKNEFTTDVVRKLIILDDWQDIKK